MWGTLLSIGAGLLSGRKKGGSTSTKQEMDPAMRPYIFGDANRRGLLDINADQLNRSQSPERMAGWQNMMNRGQGLLSGSVAGNPFSGGYQGGTNFGPPQGMTNGMGQAQMMPYQPSPQPQQPQQQMLTVDDILAEIERRRLALNPGSVGGSGWSPGDSGGSDGSGSAGTSAGVGIGSL